MRAGRGGRKRERKEKRRGERKKVQGPEKKKKGPESKVGGPRCKRRKREEGGCKRQGVGTEKARGKPY